MYYLISRLIVMVSNQQGVVRNSYREIHQWNRIDNSEVDLHKHVQINFGKNEKQFCGEIAVLKREWHGIIVYKYAK